MLSFLGFNFLCLVFFHTYSEAEVLKIYSLKGTGRIGLENNK
jgi:hypothetical protein